MSKPTLDLPIIQNWSCHNCGGCCREHLIEITEEEKRRIETQGWKASDGVCMDRPVISQLAKGRYRLAHQDNGACVFLNDKGLCRIHARFGEPAKPLACRVYPYAYHPAGKEKVAVSLRFSCPSVVRNVGDAVTSQASELATLGKEIVKGKKRDHQPPPIHFGSTHGEQEVSWLDFHQFLAAIDSALSDSSVDFAVRLMRILSWLDLVQQSQFETIRGEKLTEYLQLIVDASVKVQPDNDLPVIRPKRIGRVMFRLMTAQYARHDTEAQLREGIGVRLGLLNAALKFSFGLGTVPQLRGSASVATAFGKQSVEEGQAVVQPAYFRDLEGKFGGRRAEIDDLFVRYFRVKVQGIHFCGPANYDNNLLDGFHSLALMYPVTMWLARLRAIRNGRHQLQLEDVQAALATADHNFGYSPALGTASARQRVSMLAKMNQITALVGWYSQ